MCTGYSSNKLSAEMSFSIFKNVEISVNTTDSSTTGQSANARHRIDLSQCLDFEEMINAFINTKVRSSISFVRMIIKLKGFYNALLTD